MEPGPFVYHGAPSELIGDRLVPLYALEALDPAAFSRELTKYQGRESAPAVRVPILGCRFNDTVHCAPLHPWYILQARLAEGAPTGLMTQRTYYRIPVASITVNPVLWYRAVTIWINGAPGAGSEVPAEPPAEEFEPFDVARYSELTALPDTYRPTMRDMIAAGRRPLTFLRIPHVLVAGAIELTGAEIVDPTQPPDWEHA